MPPERDHKKRRPLHRACAIWYVAPLLAFAGQALGGAAIPTFTGDAVADFAGLTGVQNIPDPEIGDVGVPNEAPAGTVSGWDVSPNGIYLQYGWDTDTLYVGVDCTGICGDADGNGDPSGTSLWSQLNGGKDRASYGGEEWMALIIDTDNDGNFESQSSDVIVGIPRGQNFFALHAAIFDGSTQAAGASFGSPLTNPVTAEAIPDTETPDLEFAIEDFSTLPGFAFNPDGSFALRVHFAQGSDEDGGIGEEHVSGSVEFQVPRDYGDAPAPYPTPIYGQDGRLVGDGPSHELKALLNSEVYLGSCVDGEAAPLVSEATPSIMADADDNDEGSLTFGTCAVPGDDEDGVEFLTPMYPGEKATIRVTANVDCFLSAWIDFNADGDWDDLNDNLFPTGKALEPGAQEFEIDVPGKAQPGATYARFRCTTDGPTAPTGAASDGEVEDYRVMILEDPDTPRDYGDAPNPALPTLAAEGGACHVLGSEVYLGDCVDSEADGQPNINASGDDSGAGLETYGSCATPGDDEDGVTFAYTASGSLTPGATETVEVRANAACTLSAWIDFNDDGDVNDEGEALFPGGQALAAGSNSLTFTVPESAQDLATYARFRCTTDGATQPGGCASDGEVEDHPVIIGDAQRPEPPEPPPGTPPENIPVLGFWGWLLLTLGIGGLYRASGRRKA